jgi:hypothetical protein
VVIREAVFFVNVKELLIQNSSERVEGQAIFRNIGLGQRLMEGSQVGIWRNIWAIKRIMLIDNRNLILFNHGDKDRMNVEDKESRVSQEMQVEENRGTRGDGEGIGRTTEFAERAEQVAG